MQNCPPGSRSPADHTYAQAPRELSGLKAAFLGVLSFQLCKTSSGSACMANAREHPTTQGRKTGIPHALINPEYMMALHKH